MSSIEIEYTPYLSLFCQQYGEHSPPAESLHSACTVRIQWLVVHSKAMSELTVSKIQSILIRTYICIECLPRVPRNPNILYTRIFMCLRISSSRNASDSTRKTATELPTTRAHFACIVGRNSGNQEWVIRGISSVHSSNNGDQCRETPGRAVCGSSNNTGTTV